MVEYGLFVIRKVMIANIILNINDKCIYKFHYIVKLKHFFTKTILQ